MVSGGYRLYAAVFAYRLRISVPLLCCRYSLEYL
nr:MAG TPA: hypothetical protein [Caudoviricetes sp.]